jgi:predicted heme/steroid binding protein
VVGCDTEEVLPLQEEEVGEEAEEAVEQEAADQEQLFTLEELAAFDGQDGQPAYIVVDGIVYDVTNVRQWSMGSHFGFIAGTDVTDALASQAPHGANMLNQAEVVGKIAE